MFISYSYLTGIARITNLENLEKPDPEAHKKPVGSHALNEGDTEDLQAKIKEYEENELKKQK